MTPLSGDRAAYQHLVVEEHDDGAIVRILLDRPTAKNAQNRALLVELDEAFVSAEHDDRVRVVILGATGDVFSSGHDLSLSELLRDPTAPDAHPTWSINGGTRKGAESRMLQEWHYFFENTRRWRNLKKITIAQVNGEVYAAGLMLMWCCDLIVASDDAFFVDLVGARLGMCGAEYFAHPWEFGPRKAKELLLTGDALGVEDAYRLGMVSKVFRAREMADRTLEFARRIAALPTMTALLIKEAVNQTVDAMGFYTALQSCFTLHQLNHAHWAEIHDDRIPVATLEDGIRDWRHGPAITLAERSSARAESPARANEDTSRRR